jgi:hypothetical protein
MLAISVVLLALSMFFISFGNGFLSAIFLILSLIAFINTNGKGPNDDDDQRLA